MKNADMPAMPQQREWQDDMETHVANPHYGAPPMEGAGLTKREHIAAMAMQGMMASGNWQPGCFSASAVRAADELLAELEHTP